jgi:hypothetical protein
VSAYREEKDQGLILNGGAGNTYRRSDSDDDTKILQTLTRDTNEETKKHIEENVENNQLIVKR